MLRRDRGLISVRGKRYELGKKIGTGGQGEVFLASRADRPGKKYAVKLFHADRSNEDARRRAEWIARKNLSRYAPTLAAPTDAISQAGRVGVVSMYIERAKSLFDLISQGTPPSYRELALIAVQMAHAGFVVENEVQAHGDWHPGNILAWRALGVPRVAVIDWDNYAAKGVPPPQCIGAECAMAPELARHKASPNSKSDVFALAVVLHEALLLRSPFDGLGPTDADFERARGGPWLYDPVRPLAAEYSGLPVALLHPNLTRLFRYSLQPDPSRRPSARDWFDTLWSLVVGGRLACCASCGRPFMIHSRLAACPHCGTRFERQVIGPGGNALLVEDRVSIGRAHCNDAPHVSRRQADLIRRGPELYLVAVSPVSPTFVAGDSGWELVPPGERACLSPGSSFCLSDVKFDVM